MKRLFFITSLLCLPLLAPARADHLLISEIMVNPGGATDATSGHFIELYNPTSAAVPLDNYYLSNYPTYFRLPAGNFEFGDRSNFMLRFPTGAVLPANHSLVVAQNSQTFIQQFASLFGGTLDTFAQQPGHPILFEVKDTSPHVTTMVNLKAAAPRPHTLMMNPAGGFLVLFHWDGASDLVQDVDIVRWGNPATETFLPKTGQSVDGPDADTIASTYKTDAAAEANLPNGPVNVLRRVNATETGEVIPGNGNGITGHDESRENIQNTFATLPLPAATPGTPNVSLFPASVEDWQVY